MNPFKLYGDYRAAKPLLDFLERIDMKSSLFSWKSTLGGVLGLAAPLAVHFGYLTMDQGAALFAASVSFGLIAAKDANVTGGTKQQ